MDLWQILIRKYDGRLHITFPAYLIDDDGERLSIRAQVGGALNQITRGSNAPIFRSFDVVQWRSRWYNIYTNYDEQMRVSNYYCNAALPPTFADHELTFIDLDLDVRFWMDGRIEILDEDEFIEHSALFGNPDTVQQHARRAVDALLALWEAKLPPFDR